MQHLGEPVPERSAATTPVTAALATSHVGVWYCDVRSRSLSVQLFFFAEPESPDAARIIARQVRIAPIEESKLVNAISESAANRSAYVKAHLRIELEGRPSNWYVVVGGPCSTDASVYTGLLAEAAGYHEGVGDRSYIGELHDTVLDSLTEEVAIANHNGEIIDCNRAWRATDTGYAVLGRRVATGSNYLDALREAAERYADAAAVLDGIRRVLKAQASCFQYEYSCTREGRERWFAIRVTPLQRPDGGLVVIHHEITDRRRAERERDLHRAELSRASRAAAVGEMSGAIAHELNQPLTAILANAQVGIEEAVRAGVDGELLAILKDIESDTKRAGEVIKRVRALLKHRESDFAPINLNLIVTEVLSLSHADVLMRGVNVSTSLDRSLPLLRGDAIELQQLLLNLVANACEAMTETERGNRNMLIATSVQSNGRVELSVSDSGGGFGDVGQDRLLQPFYTTKGDGLGLGLTICAAIVQAHGGTMRLGKGEHGGARVSVEFPQLTVSEWHDASRPSAPGTQSLT